MHKWENDMKTELKARG